LVKDFLESNPLKTLDHPADFLAFAPADFYLFPKLKSTLQGQRFCDTTNLIKNSTEELKSFHRMASRNVSNNRGVAGRSIFAQGAFLKEIYLK
jgi:hypothetical protein